MTRVDLHGEGTRWEAIGPGRRGRAIGQRESLEVGGSLPTYLVLFNTITQYLNMR